MFTRARRDFVRWMDGTCVEMPDQRTKGEEGEPLVMHFNSEVMRIQPVRGGMHLGTTRDQSLPLPQNSGTACIGTVMHHA